MGLLTLNPALGHSALRSRNGDVWPGTCLHRTRAVCFRANPSRSWRAGHHRSGPELPYLCCGLRLLSLSESTLTSKAGDHWACRGSSAGSQAFRNTRISNPAGIGTFRIIQAKGGHLRRARASSQSNAPTTRATDCCPGRNRRHLHPCAVGFVRLPLPTAPRVRCTAASSRICCSAEASDPGELDLGIRALEIVARSLPLRTCRCGYHSRVQPDLSAGNNLPARQVVLLPGRLCHQVESRLPTAPLRCTDRRCHKSCRPLATSRVHGRTCVFVLAGCHDVGHEHRHPPHSAGLSFSHGFGWLGSLEVDRLSPKPRMRRSRATSVQFR